MRKGNNNDAAQSAARVRRIQIDRIQTPRSPVRRFLGDIAALAESMQDFGLQQPISVRADGDRFMLTSGLRRLEAARLLGWKTIPAFVRNVSADDAYVVDLIENLQRQDLSPEEEADALRELVRTRGWSLQQVADTIKRSLGYVSKRVRLFEDGLLRQAVTERGMPVSTAEELLASAPEQRQQLIEQALAERWDQVRARDALRWLAPSPSESEFELEQSAGSALGDEPMEPASRPIAAASDDGQRRPRGLTRAVREFHRLITQIQPVDLTPSDRAALRSLFRDLVLLARASTTPRAPVFPPLPATTARSSRSTSNGRRSGAQVSKTSRRAEPSLPRAGA